MSRLITALVLLGLTLSIGCTEPTGTAGAAGNKPAAGNAPPVNQPADDGKGIIGKTTQDIGKYDPNAAHQVVSNQKIHATDPITGPLSAYGPMAENIAIIRIKSEINTFEAIEGHYPTYEEFMERIIKANNIQLPVLPYKGRYMYDEATHELKIVRDPENAEKMK